MPRDSWTRFEQRTHSLTSNATTSYWERYFSPHTHPGGGVLRTAAQKWRVLALFVLRRLAQGPGRHRALSALREIRGSARDKDVLIIGSGPSASALNHKEVSTRQQDGSLVVVATNYFLLSPLAKNITPDFLVWSDSVFSPKNREKNPEVWEALTKHSTVTVIAPWTWQSVIVTMSVADRFVYFDNDSLEGWSSNISPLSPRGYQGTTGVKALAMGLHLQPRNVFLIGLDLSYFQQFGVDTDNRVLRHPTHLSGTDSGVQDLTDNTVNGIADVLYSTANQFLALRTHFSGHPIVNLDQASLVDAFPKASAHPLVAPPKNTRTRSRKKA